jgi:hypothetical protein
MSERILIPLEVIREGDTTPPLSHPMIKTGTREAGPEERQKPKDTSKGKTKAKDLKRGGRTKRKVVSNQPKKRTTAK